MSERVHVCHDVYACIDKKHTRLRARHRGIRARARGVEVGVSVSVSVGKNA